MLAVSFGLAAVAGHPADGFWGWRSTSRGIGAALALSSIFTVALAYPAEKRVGSPMPRAADGYRGQALAGTLGSLIGVALATVPVILAAGAHRLGSGRGPDAGARVCAAGYGLALAWLGVRIAARTADRRLPELCQLAVRSKL